MTTPPSPLTVGSAVQLSDKPATVIKANAVESLKMPPALRRHFVGLVKAFAKECPKEFEGIVRELLEEREQAENPS